MLGPDDVGIAGDDERRGLDARDVVGRPALRVVSSSRSFSTSAGKFSGFGASRLYSASNGEPAKVSGVICSNMGSSSGYMPSVL